MRVPFEKCPGKEATVSGRTFPVQIECFDLLLHDGTIHDGGYRTMSAADNLDAIRKGIDEVDEAITRLLEKRMDYVREVAAYKQRTGMAIHDPAREQKILERILSKVDNPAYKASIASVYTAIMKASRDFQARLLSMPSESSGAKYGLIGKKLSHSLSPKIHDLLFGEMGIPGQYDLVEASPEELPGLLERLKSLGYRGVNVTIPYKKDIMPYLDSLSDEAAHIGAVNTICLTEGYRGYNTDYDGFGMALEVCGAKTQGARCAVLGSGGAARAVVAYLKDHGAATITLVSRDPESAVQKFPGLAGISLDAFSARGYDLVINTTPVGMYPDVDRSPLRKDQLDGAGFVMDLIYNPEKTVLLRYAEELGIRHDNGLYMLVAQAFRAEEIWQGKTLDRALIRKVMDEIRGSI